MLKRPLALAHDGARHPLRQRFPRFFQEATGGPAEVMSPEGGLKLFAMSFTAFFTIFYGMIA